MKIARFVVCLLLLGAGVGTLASPAEAYPAGVIGTATINGITFAPGDTVVVKVQHTTPGPMTMQIFSDPVTIGTGTVGHDAKGTVRGVIPAGYSGAHTIQIDGAGGEIYPFNVTINGGGGGLCNTGGIDHYTVIASQTLDIGYFGCVPAARSQLVTATFTLGDWSGALTTTSESNGDASFFGTVTDPAHSLPVGTTTGQIALTDGAGNSVGNDSFVVAVSPENTLPRSCPAGTVSGPLSFTGIRNLQGGLYSGTLILAYQGVHTGSDTTAPGTVDFDSASYDVADGTGAITVNLASPTRTTDVDETVAVSPASCSTSDLGGLFRSLTPARVLDTRAGNGAPKVKIGPGQNVTVQMTGRGGLPTTGVGSVVMNATVTNPTASGYISVYPAGGTRPVVSSLNFVKGQTVPNAVTTPVSADGKVTFYNGSGGTVDLIADVSGYFISGTPTSAGAFASVAPTRILDTRSGNGAPKAKVGAGKALAVQLTGRGGLPVTGVAAVVLNTTVTNPTGSGYLTAYPSGTTRPVVSNLNFRAGQTAPNAVTVPVGTDGKVAFYNGSGGTLDLLADISGYYLAGTPTEPGAFVSLTPARVLDTRSGNGAPTAKVTSLGSLTVQLAGRGSIPTSGVASVVLNATATNPTGSGYITIYPAGGTRPVVSSLNFAVAQTIPNAVTVPTSASGAITLYNGSGGTVDLLADVAGYYLAAPPA